MRRRVASRPGQRQPPARNYADQSAVSRPVPQPVPGEESDVGPEPGKRLGCEVPGERIQRGHNLSDPLRVTGTQRRGEGAVDRRRADPRDAGGDLRRRPHQQPAPVAGVNGGVDRARLAERAMQADTLLCGNPVRSAICPTELPGCARMSLATMSTDR
jgi:hypothetical protein